MVIIGKINFESLQEFVSVGRHWAGPRLGHLFLGPMNWAHFRNDWA